MDERGDITTSDDLTTSLFELASLVADAVPLEQALQQLVLYPMQLIPSAEGAVLSLLENGARDITVATDALVRLADDAHNAAGEGPSLTAMAHRRVVTSASLGGDPDFPRFGSRVARLGLHSVIAAPFMFGDSVSGVITVYGRAKHAFDAADLRLLEDYAKPAAIVARNAQVLARSHRKIEQLNEALRVRPIIDQAIGIIRHRTGQSAEEAFERLREISIAGRVKVALVARDVVDEAVREAQTRNPPKT